ncbi:MAG: TetR/AcrR family transcriptional regulator [Thermodesulfobacteriota bacterium]
MARNKVISINTHAEVKNKLLQAVGQVLASTGFTHCTAERVAQEAGVQQVNIERFFGDVAGLVSVYAESGAFWPQTPELFAETEAQFAEFPPDQQIASFFKSLLVCLRRRPQTLDILAWESVQRNELSRRLEDVRVRTALEYFEHLDGDIAEDIDLTAIVALLAAAVVYLGLQSRNTRTFGGIDLHSDQGWQRIEQAIALLMQGSLTP